jgi:hypothetical protein
MADSKYSSAAIAKKRLRKDFPYTSLTLAVTNAVPAAASKELLSSQQDPWPNEIKADGEIGPSHPAVGVSHLKRHMAEDGWGLAAKAYVCERRTAKEMDERYHEVIALWALFADIAQQNAARGKEQPGEILFSLPPSIGLLSSLKLFRHRARLEAKGLLKKVLDEGQLDGIKRCAYEKCGRFFWAQRIDRPCCQESCRNAYRQKRHREREKQNRVTKKRLRKKKERG